ncbi:MAG: thioesterase family protein [Candidatus Phaeomarinobacter sp.]
MIESYLSAVSVAECDEMGHMNIQHYAAKAEAAARVLTALSPRNDNRHNAPVQMHLRFHREMLAGDRVRVQSARPDTAPDEGSANGRPSSQLVHRIENVGTGLLCATALCTYKNDRAPDAPISDMPEDAQPRSITTPAPDGLTQQAAVDAGLRRTHLSAISEDDCVNDKMSIPAFLQRVSRSQSHLWSMVGFGRRQQAEAGLGTASLELRVTRLAPAPPGRALEIVTGFTPPTGKALHYRHAGFDAVTGACCFIAEGVGVMMDLSTRRAVRPPIPQTDFA